MAKTTDYGPDGSVPQILLIAPPPVVDMTDTPFEGIFYGAVEKSKHFAAEYLRVAEEQNVHFLDAGQHIVCSPLDAIHYEPDEHGKLGKVVADVVRAILG